MKPHPKTRTNARAREARRRQTAALLESFALEVLRLLESQPEWSAATVDDISAAAFNRNLADVLEHHDPTEAAEHAA